MIDGIVLFYATNQKIISVLFIIAPIVVLMLRHHRQWRRLSATSYITAGACGAALQTGLLLIIVASAPDDTAAKIEWPPQVAIWGGLSLIYAYKEFEKLWKIKFGAKNDN